ncbi:hypothetical protein P3W53_09580, partial [Pseudomonas denitrificans (nom. rej.)]|nr:hypothetical protein [Pseudomonas denitrificans (nom. rej.)]
DQFPDSVAADGSAGRNPGLMLNQSVLAAGNSDAIYGAPHQKTASLLKQQAQIVMFRDNGGGEEAAHVYRYGHLQRALMPGGYAVFCTAAGEHSVESHIGDALLSTVKRDPQSNATLDGGATYILEVPGDPKRSTPIVRTGKHAERSLQDMRRQLHVISCATSVVPCQSETTLGLRSDVLFKCG